MTGSLLVGTVKVYSTFIMLNFPTLEECTKVHQEIYNDNTKCFISYKDVYEKISMPLPRPEILVEEDKKKR
tara:strand:- start:239 stop:451 length:213 start_codon:yes stop_codon:yes gene_type:complete